MVLAWEGWIEFYCGLSCIWTWARHCIGFLGAPVSSYRRTPLLSTWTESLPTSIFTTLLSTRRQWGKFFYIFKHLWSLFINATSSSCVAATMGDLWVCFLLLVQSSECERFFSGWIWTSVRLFLSVVCIWSALTLHTKCWANVFEDRGRKKCILFSLNIGVFFAGIPEK